MQDDQRDHCVWTQNRRDSCTSNIKPRCPRSPKNTYSQEFLVHHVVIPVSCHPKRRQFPGLGDTIPTELQKQRDQVAPSDVLPALDLSQRRYMTIATIHWSEPFEGLHGCPHPRKIIHFNGVFPYKPSSDKGVPPMETARKGCGPSPWSQP